MKTCPQNKNAANPNPKKHQKKHQNKLNSKPKRKTASKSKDVSSSKAPKVSAKDNVGHLMIGNDENWWLSRKHGESARWIKQGSIKLANIQLVTQKDTKTKAWKLLFKDYDDDMNDDLMEESFNVVFDVNGKKINALYTEVGDVQMFVIKGSRIMELDNLKHPSKDLIFLAAWVENNEDLIFEQTRLLNDDEEDEEDEEEDEEDEEDEEETFEHVKVTDIEIDGTYIDFKLITDKTSYRGTAEIEKNNMFVFKVKDQYEWQHQLPENACKSIVAQINAKLGTSHKFAVDE